MLAVNLGHQDIVRPPHRVITCLVTIKITDELWRTDIFSLCIIMCHMCWNRFHMIMKSYKDISQSDSVVNPDIKQRKARQ